MNSVQGSTELYANRGPRPDGESLHFEKHFQTTKQPPTEASSLPGPDNLSLGQMAN